MANQIDHSRLPVILKEFDVQVLGILSLNTRKQYLFNLLKFFKWLESKNTSPENISRKVVSEFLNYQTKQGKKPRTKHVSLSSVKKFAKWLWEENKLNSKELQKIQDIPIRIPKGEIAFRALTREEIKLAFQKISHPIHRFLFWVGINYGLRNQEYSNLRIGDVDLKKGLLTVKNSKRAKTRRIPITPKQKREWQNWFQQREILYQPDHKYVFLTANGKIMKTTLETYFRKIATIVFPEDPDKRFTSHNLRKTYATILWRKGVDILIISKMLGHSNISVTQEYLAVTEEEIQERYLNAVSDFM